MHHYFSFRFAPYSSGISAYCEMISSVSLVNMCHHTQLQNFFLVVTTFGDLKVSCNFDVLWKCQKVEDSVTYNIGHKVTL